MGLAEKDVDDGITLLYLLGKEDIELAGITSTFGNGEVEEVNQVIERMRHELAIDEIPFKKGAASAGDLETPAAEFLVKKARANKGEIVLLATGALTNLKAACRLDPNFFSYLKEIRVMGGVTEQLSFGEKEIDELNFSCDPEAVKLVLEAPVPIMVATGNLCSTAFFNTEDWAWLQEQVQDIYQYISNNIEEWYYYGPELVGQLGFHLWDLVPAVYITHPNLYKDKYYKLESDIEDLTTGQLKLTPVEKSIANKDEPGLLNIPSQIKDVDHFKELIFSTWGNIN